LSIPTTRCDGQIFNRIIKQEIIGDQLFNEIIKEEKEDFNDGQLLQKGYEFKYAS